MEFWSSVDSGNHLRVLRNSSAFFITFKKNYIIKSNYFDNFKIVLLNRKSIHSPLI